MAARSAASPGAGPFRQTPATIRPSVRHARRAPGDRWTSWLDVSGFVGCQRAHSWAPRCLRPSLPLPKRSLRPGANRALSPGVVGVVLAGDPAHRRRRSHATCDGQVRSTTEVPIAPAGSARRRGRGLLIGTRPCPCEAATDLPWIAARCSTPVHDDAPAQARPTNVAALGSLTERNPPTALSRPSQADVMPGAPALVRKMLRGQCLMEPRVKRGAAAQHHEETRHGRNRNAPRRFHR